MIGNFFNPAQSFKDITQNMFDFGKFFNLQNLSPDLNLSKFWDFNKKNLDTASGINKALNSDMTDIADKQAALVKDNTESFTNAMKEISQSQMTPQKILEIQGKFYQEISARNMKCAKELGEMCTKVSMKLLEECSNGVKGGMNDYCNTIHAESCGVYNKKC
jgi:hypothetical protein